MQGQAFIGSIQFPALEPTSHTVPMLSLQRGLFIHHILLVSVVSAGALARTPAWIGQLDPGTWSTQNTRDPYLDMSKP